MKATLDPKDAQALEAAQVAKQATPPAAEQYMKVLSPEFVDIALDTDHAGVKTIEHLDNLLKFPVVQQSAEPVSNLEFLVPLTIVGIGIFIILKGKWL